jgi:hypothetical protein
MSKQPILEDENYKTVLNGLNLRISYIDCKLFLVAVYTLLNTLVMLAMYMNMLSDRAAFIYKQRESLESR